MPSSASRHGPRLIEIEGADELAPRLAQAGLSGRRPVIVLIGGAAGIEGEDLARLEPVIDQGVVATAGRLGAAIIDGGTNAGVMALAGRARAGRGGDAPLIGVVPRGRISAPGIDSGGTTELEPNHSHVLVVPGAEWGEESGMLLRAARLTAGGQPVVTVLVDGGPVALAEAMACAAQGWPIVAVAGSGRSADVLAGYARGANDPELTPTDRRGIHVVQLDAGPAALADMLARLLEGGGSVGTEPGRVDGSESFRSADYPALYVAASEAAKRGQRTYRLLALGEILLTSLGLAVALVVTTVLGGDQLNRVIGGGAAALAFLTALVLKLINRSSGFDADWYGGRALAETVKSLTWRYMMRVSPYADQDPDRRFRVDLATLLRRRAGFRQAVDRLPARPQQISPLMRKVRASSLGARRDYYVAQRVFDQADWYRRRGARSSRWSGRWFWLSIAAQLVGAALALATFAILAMGWQDDVLRLVALAGAIALAMTAWSQLNRYDELSRSYAVALQELLLIAAVGDGVQTQTELEELVADAEEAIGREHRLWIAKRAESAAEGEPGLDEMDSAEAAAGT